jgi:sulfur carrier protein ThiS
MSSNITLIVIPGPGARTVSVEDNTTVAQLVSSENLHGRDIIINGEGIPATAYQTATISAGAEVLAADYSWKHSRDLCYRVC